VTSPMGLVTVKPSVAPTLVRNAGHQDDVVAPQLASVALSIGNERPLACNWLVHKT
jgi:hypothetical protein